jgi:hypothetical protein
MFAAVLDRSPAPNPKLRALLKSKAAPWELSVIITREKRWFVVECPGLPGCVQGRTEHSALANIRDAIRLSLETRWSAV